MNDREKPILKGDVYCSPRCGFGCKKAAYDQAVQEADALAARMGDGWVPRIWENCGWNYSVDKGVALIYPFRDGSATAGSWEVIGYTVFFNSVKQVVTDAKTPEDAVGFALQDARTAARQIASDCAALSSSSEETVPA